MIDRPFFVQSLRHSEGRGYQDWIIRECSSVGTIIVCHSWSWWFLFKLTRKRAQDLIRRANSSTRPNEPVSHRNLSTMTQSNFFRIQASLMIFWAISINDKFCIVFFAILKWVNIRSASRSVYHGHRLARVPHLCLVMLDSTAMW